MTDPLDEHLDEALEVALQSNLAELDLSGAGLASEEAAASDDLPLPAKIGRFVTSSVLGHGGMGIILRARDPRLEREVAVKVLRGTLAEQRQARLQFIEEARICGKLQHPGIVPIYEVGLSQDGRPFFAMKIVDGSTLAELMAGGQGNSSERQRWTRIYQSVCEAVSFAHSRGVVHSDLKPSNVMAGRYGEVQVLDWGLATLSFRSVPGEAKIIGTPAYMSPEKARGDIDCVDARSDVFSLGSMLCEILTGQPAYAAGNAQEAFLMARKAWLEDANARLDRCGAADDLVNLARHCLATDPDDRPADAGFLADEVARCLASMERRVRAAELVATEAKTKAQEAQKTRRVTIILAIAVIALLAVGIAYLHQEVKRAEAATLAQRAAARSLERARYLRDQAVAFAKTADSASQHWLAAITAAERAATLATAEHVEPERRRLAQQLLVQVRQIQISSVRDQKMKHRLEELRPHLGSDPPGRQLVNEYRKAFREYGLPLDAVDSAERWLAFSRLRASAISSTLTDALVEMAWMTGSAGRNWREFLDLASATNSDPWRATLILACRDKDTSKLVAIARSPDAQSAPASGLRLLARFLAGTKRTKLAVEVLRRAHQHHCGDFHLNHDLASLLGAGDNPEWGEIVRLCWMAVAIRPGSAHAWTDLGQALMASRQDRQAEKAYRRALALVPSYGRAKFYLGIVLRRLGRSMEAVYQWRKVVRPPGRRLAASLSIVTTLMQEGHVYDALRSCREALVSAPDSVVLRHELAKILRQLGYLKESNATIRALIKDDRARQHRPLLLCLLGLILRDQGKLTEAASMLRRGHEAGSQDPNWEVPSARWLAEVKDWQNDFRRIIANDVACTELREGPRLIRTAFCAGLHVAVCRMYQRMFDVRNEHARTFDPTNLSLHAESAAYIAAGHSMDLEQAGPALGPKTAASLARTWLRASLAQLRSRQKEGVASVELVRRRLHRWRHGRAFQPFRDHQVASKADAKSCATRERRAWRDLWQEVDDWLTQLKKGHPPPK